MSFALKGIIFISFFTFILLLTFSFLNKTCIPEENNPKILLTVEKDEKITERMLTDPPKYCLNELLSIQDLTKIDHNNPPPEAAILSSEYGTLVPNHIIDTLISYFNQLGRLRNGEKFKLSDVSMVFQIIVGDSEAHATYFEQMLKYLSRVDGIESVLLVISHDGINQKILNSVDSIDFCPVKQLFFPGGKIYTNRFPGPDNSLIDTKDSYGHSREWKFPGMRHHFWWAINSVFHLEELSHFESDVCFFDGDYMVTPDIFHTTKELEKIRIKSCPKCFGTFLSRFDSNFLGRSAKKKNAIVNTHESTGGLCFNRTMYRELQAKAHDWCSFDDYNYDFAFKNLKRTKKILNDFISVEPPRIWHAGHCGFHYKGTCELSKTNMQQFEEYCRSTEPLDGEKTTYKNIPASLPRKVQYGGFAHPEDYKWCMQMSHL